MRKKNAGRKNFHFVHYLLFCTALVCTALLCVCVGSVRVSLNDTIASLRSVLLRQPPPPGLSYSIIINVRLPRVFCAALVGAALSLCGGAMQGLLRNPLADGSTLGVSSGASLGAGLALCFGVTFPWLPFTGVTMMAILFAFGSLIFILSLAYKMDHSLSTNTIILVGVIFSMFANSIISLIVAFSGDHVKSIMFWMMGSLANGSYFNVLTLLCALLLFGALILRNTRELDAFAIGEDNARHVGVHVRRVKMMVMISVSALIGVCVSVGGTIGFVGLVDTAYDPYDDRAESCAAAAGDALLGRDIPHALRFGRACPLEPLGAAHRRGDVADRLRDVCRDLLSQQKGKLACCGWKI
jgi:iron complex transport system permease protein